MTTATTTATTARILTFPMRTGMTAATALALGATAIHQAITGSHIGLKSPASRRA